MAALTRRYCSVCDAVLSEPSEAAQPTCPACEAGDADNSLPPPPSMPMESHSEIAPLSASDKTSIMSREAEQDTARDNMTVDFVPSSDQTELLISGINGDHAAKRLQFGRFQVISVLGHGSFGTVYRAYDPLLDREVALKVPRFALDDRAMLERFHREAKAAARLHHPNIVALHESGETDDGPYLVAEFVDGVTLSQRLREQRHDLHTVVDWVRQIAEGLHYAHSEGVIHRDIKPANIMMNRAGRPQVMDFGLAKRDADIAAGMTVEGQIVGTPTYMSPEQARGAIAEVGPHSDQYSVGVVLYEMLCGRVPFAGDPWTVVSRVANVHESPPAPRSLRPDLPCDLEACCLKALEKVPGARYPSLQALADDLDHWLKGLPLVARPIGPLERLQRWCRKNQLIAGLAGTLAMMIVVATIVGYGLAFRFRALATVAANEARAADAARKLEKTTRLDGERVIIDAYTETGLTADRNGDPREAILWFANAVAASGNHPLREKHNRIRMQSWLSQIAIPVRAFSQPAAWNKGLSYHPSGRLLLSLSLSGQCEVLEISSGQRLALPTNGPVSAATWSPDGMLLVLASYQDVAVFDFPKNTEVDRWTHPDPVNCLQFNADGVLLVVGGDKTTQVRDVPKKSFRTAPMEIGSQVTSIAIAPNSRRFAVRGFDQQVRVFSCAPEQPNAEPLLPVQPSASDGNLPPMFVGSDRLVIVDNHHSVRCWDLSQTEIVWEQEIKRVLSSAISPDGKWIALGEDFDVVLLDAASGRPAEERITHPNLINNLSFHPRSSLLLTASEDHAARIFEIPSGMPVGPPIPHNNAVHRCVWSPDGTT
ncbi:MAG: protein kinase, partial [Candidatus Saccharimonas sp.]|nr:protein kinase [Planctomycetaceae bacterium]